VLKKIAFCKDNDGLLYAESKWSNFSKKHLLLENYTHSDFKEALILMVNYVIERKNKIINVLKGFF
jgi:octaprenyl-diphosphate synthase